MMANRVDFYPVDVGALHVGATSFSLYNTLPPSAIAFVLGNAEAKVVVCEAQYVERIRESGALLEQIVVIDAEAGIAPAGTLTLDQMKALGSPEFDFDAAWRSVRPDDVATLIYTSGTTGNRKGWSRLMPHCCSRRARCAGSSRSSSETASPPSCRRHTSPIG